MMKFCRNLLVTLLIPLSTHALNEIDRQVIDEETILVNGGFENGKAEWVQSGGTWNIVTASPLFGKAHATFQASGSGQYIETALKTIPQGLKGKNCIARQAYENGDGNLKMQVMDGSSAVLAEVVLTADILSAEANFICPSSGSLKIRTISTAASASVKVDKYKLGLADNLRGVSQAIYVGSVNFSGCSTSPFNSSGSFASMTGTGCTITASGGVQTTGGQTVALVLPSGAPGLYQLELEGMFGSSASSQVTHFQGYDGSNTSQDQATFVGYAGYGGNHASLTIKETSALSNVTFEIRGKKDGSGDPTVVATSPYNATLKLYYWPSQEQIAVNSNCVGTASCENRFNTTISVCTSSPCTVVSQNLSWVSSVTRSSTGIYVVNFNSSLFSATPNCTVSTDTGNISLSISPISSSSAQINSTASTTSGTYDVGFTLSCDRVSSDRKPQMPVPILVGSVTSNAVGALRQEAALVHYSGATPSITTTTSTFVSSISIVGTGDATLNFVAGTWSSNPICQCTGIYISGGSSLDMCNFRGVATTSSVRANVFQNALATDTDFYITCIGPR